MVDTDSRAATPEDAVWRIKTLLARVRPLTPSGVFKKIDSTLRGHIGPELRTLLDALPDAVAIVCPVFPKQGRTCRDGVVFVNGVRIDDAAFAHDPLWPVADARVAANLDAPAAALTLTQLRAGGDGVRDAVEYVRSHGIRIVVADAETDDDLRALARLARGRDDVLWFGSAGLLEMLADEVQPEACRWARRRHAERDLSGGVRRRQPQCDDAATGFGVRRQRWSHRARRCGRALEVDGANDAAAAPGGTIVHHAHARARAAVSAGTDTLVAITGERERVEAALAYAGARGWERHETSRRIREALVAITDGVVDSESGGIVVLSGGDVARSFCERRGIQGLDVLAEVAPGIPVSRAIGANLLVVTKAGGFGHPETYRDIVAALHAQVPR